jgi:hypothetical protein
MPTNYLDLRDTDISLSAADPVFVFAPFNAPDVDVTRRPILMYRVNPGTLPAGVEFTLNGTVVNAETFQTAPSRAWLEILNAGDVQPANNVLVLNRTSGDCTISEVIIFHPTT